MATSKILSQGSPTSTYAPPSANILGLIHLLLIFKAKLARKWSSNLDTNPYHIVLFSLFAPSLIYINFIFSHPARSPLSDRNFEHIFLFYYTLYLLVFINSTSPLSETLNIAHSLLF